MAESLLLTPEHQTLIEEIIKKHANQFQVSVTLICQLAEAISSEIDEEATATAAERNLPPVPPNATSIVSVTEYLIVLLLMTTYGHFLKTDHPEMLRRAGLIHATIDRLIRELSMEATPMKIPTVCTTGHA